MHVCSLLVTLYRRQTETGIRLDMVVRGTVPAEVRHFEPALGVRLPGLGCLAPPAHPLGEVLLNAFAVVEGAAEAALRVGLALLSGGAPPPHGFHRVPRDTPARSAHRRQVRMHHRVPVLRGQAKPRDGLNVVLRDALAVDVHQPEDGLRRGVAHFRALAPEHGSLCVVGLGGRVVLVLVDRMSPIPRV